MLVLTRKINDRVVIDGGIEIKVLDVQGTRVKLGITAPDDVGIRRGELDVAVASTPQGFPNDPGDPGHKAALAEL